MEMIQSFQNLPSKSEFWVGILIPRKNPYWNLYNSDLKDKINPKIKEAVLEMGLSLIAFYTELDSNWSGWYLLESVHHSFSGAEIIA